IGRWDGTATRKQVLLAHRASEPRAGAVQPDGVLAQGLALERRHGPGNGLAGVVTVSTLRPVRLDVLAAETVPHCGAVIVHGHAEGAILRATPAVGTGQPVFARFQGCDRAHADASNISFRRSRNRV